MHTTDGGITWDAQGPDYYSGTGGYNNLITDIQQIDSLNVVGIGWHGLIFRTFNGGKNWEKQDCHTLKNLSQVHFSDPLVGILVCYDSAIYTTTNGGKDWNAEPVSIFSSYGLSQCHSFGNGKFSVVARGRGPIYTTSDNWKTVDSSSIFVDTSKDNFPWFYFTHCVFGGDDTIIAAGYYTLNGADGAIVRSTDKGQHWEEPVVIKDAPSGIEAITPMTGNTMLATGNDHLIISTDRGESWNRDTILLDTNYRIVYCTGLVWARSQPLAIFSNGAIYTPNVIFRGTSLKSLVNKENRENINVSIFPNPATDAVHIITPLQSLQICLYDVLGRVVRRGITDNDGRINFDIRGLPFGIYTVLSEHQGMEMLGKFMIGR